MTRSFILLRMNWHGGGGASCLAQDEPPGAGARGIFMYLRVGSITQPSASSNTQEDAYSHPPPHPQYLGLQGWGVRRIPANPCQTTSSRAAGLQPDIIK